jgi:urea carboxylase
MHGKGFTASRGNFKVDQLHTVLIANRGEIALRLLRCCDALSLKTVVVYTAEDAGSPHAGQGTHAVLLQGKESEGKGYLDKQAIIEAAKKHNAQVILPGYGFLSENEEFAKLVEDAGIIFAGPRSDTIRDLGLKHICRQLAKKANVPCVPGSDLLKDEEEAIQEAKRIGYPVMLKASAGGGGLGLQVCHDQEQLSKAYESVSARSKSLFGSSTCFLEKYIERGHHIEVQIFGNGLGDVVDFGERECSIQRRHQKVIEEAPSAFVQSRKNFRKEITECARRFASQAKYKSAGTLEFLVDDDTGEFYFLECNTRLQVEHCVTEMVWDIDLVALMLQQAQYEVEGKGGIPSKDLLSLQRSDPTGWAIEARCYCENPLRNYAPSPGQLQLVEWNTTDNDRVDGWVSTGTIITPSYDPLLAKVISRGENRKEAITNLTRLLRKSIVYGPTNKDFLASILESDAFIKGPTLTNFLTESGFKYTPIALQVLDGGVSTSIQDLPARSSIGHGIPIAGPMDPMHFRLANVIVGNPQTIESLEITFKGPTLQFYAPCVICLVGAEMDFYINDESVEMFSAIQVKANSIIRIGIAKKGGCRAYLAILGGFPSVPLYLDSRSTTGLIALGGHQGRDLQTGDVLEIQSVESRSMTSFTLPTNLRFNHFEDKEVPLYCMRGPFDDEEYITKDGLDTIYGKPMKVGHNIARTGLRLECDLLQWARTDGGEGGSHPSNVLEIGYSIGGLNWNGDTPVILGPDGPDLGGLLISTTLVSCEYRAGQLTPGTLVRWVPISFSQARVLSSLQDDFLKQIESARGGKVKIESIKPLRMKVDGIKSYHDAPGPILDTIPGDANRARVIIRAAGDRNMLLEIGEMTADIVNRCRLELLLRQLNDLKKPGILYCDPNIRSLTIRFDPSIVSQDEVLKLIRKVEGDIPNANQTKIPSREWNLPVCLDHPDVGKSVDRYREMTRNKAVWLDSKSGTDNKGYLARANGLSSIQEVEKAILGTKMLTVANGFWLGTPILLPQDQRKRLRCMKYNPTRLQTPEGALGIGGSMAAIYGCESAGGYQLIGRTLPGWSTHGKLPGFNPKRPWLFEPFDVLNFYQVNAEEYDSMLAKFKAGGWKWDVKQVEYDVAEQVKFEDSIKEEVIVFRRKQQEALIKVEEEEKELFKQWTDEKQQKADANKGGTDQDWDWQSGESCLGERWLNNADDSFLQTPKPSL